MTAPDAPPYLCVLEAWQAHEAELGAMVGLAVMMTLDVALG